MTASISLFSVLLLMFAGLACSQRTALWVTTGGQLTRDRAVRLEAATQPDGDVEAVCYVGSEGLLPTEQVPTSTESYPLLCVASSPTQSAPSTALLDRYEESGGAALPFLQTRWSSARVRVTATRHTPACALAVGDLLCAEQFGAAFQLSSRPRGLWAFCGNPPEPSGSRVFALLDPPAAPANDSSRLAACRGVPRVVPVDECWDENPCMDPRDCFDQRRTVNSSATCGAMGPVEAQRTSFFNQCVRLIGNDFCVDVYTGKAAPNATDDGECSFGAKVTRNNELVFEREIDVGAAPFA
jgi:hypothetical protein